MEEVPEVSDASLAGVGWLSGSATETLRRVRILTFLLQKQLHKNGQFLTVYGNRVTFVESSTKAG